MFRKKTIIENINFRLKFIIKYIYKYFIINYRKLIKIQIDPVIAYGLIALVWTFIIIINMKEYMEYQTFRYMNNSYIRTAYAFNNQVDNTQIEASNLNSAMDSDPNNSEDIIMTGITNGKMTSWGGETDKYELDINIENLSNENNDFQINSVENDVVVNKFEINQNAELKNNIVEPIVKQLDKSNLLNNNLSINNEIINTKNVNQNLKVINIVPSIKVDNKTEENNVKTNYSNLNQAKSDKNIVDLNIVEIKKEEKIVYIDDSKTDKQITTDNTNLLQSSKKIQNTNLLENNIKIENNISSDNNIMTKQISVSQNIDELSKSINNEINTELGKFNTSIYDGFNLKVLNNRNLVLDNGVWYTYVFSKFHGFGKGIIPSEDDFKNGGIFKDKTILLIDKTTGINFVNDYKKVKLISDNIINNISNKEIFLTELADDKKYLFEDTDDLFIKLKNETFALTNGLSENKKIQKIYDYILKNINYSKVFDVNNKFIFSGIYTYKNKDGICSGYSKLDLYMLSFAGVNNVKVVKGNVIDAPDFPNIGHAWIKIGSQYYDPTFDDPIGNTGAKNFNEYKYFGLPKDLFYTNRFDYGSLPGDLKVANLETRKNYIQNQLFNLYDKYSDNNYILLKSIGFKKKYGLKLSEKITIDKLKELIPNYEANNFKYIDNGTEIIINDIDYYTISDSNLDYILEKVGYDLNGLILFKWDNGTYRLAYKLS